jgi:hypothetical protein
MVEAATVKSLKSFLSARDRVELDVDFTIGVSVNGDVDNLAVLLVALDPDFGLEIFDPAIAVLLLFSANNQCLESDNE